MINADERSRSEPDGGAAARPSVATERPLQVTTTDEVVAAPAEAPDAAGVEVRIVFANPAIESEPAVDAAAETDPLTATVMDAVRAAGVTDASQLAGLRLVLAEPLEGEPAAVLPSSEPAPNDFDDQSFALEVKSDRQAERELSLRMFWVLLGVAGLTLVWALVRAIGA